ncbi:MAG: dihydropteroate synthase [Desulfobacter postgatei]|uniref:dihydropteroate synthase n=1 Tax=Desulfobacter postgatei TaxID=2293 RepID=UPI0023F36186|nr:dihydropteroate synthase [Desulfobacter postgatei]MDD4273026.1 dihydropteroate synthase [Desulfobacter postgatei]
MTTTPFTLEFGRFKLDLGPRACIMGILNTTPDSFSDGGKYTSLDKALTRAHEMVAAGAHILDIGGESSRPFSEPVSEQEELDRTIPVIEAIASRIDIPISIDTVKAKVAKEALAAGGSIINDISAFEKDPGMLDVALETGAPAVLMHMKGTPETMQVNPSYDDLMGEIITYLQERVNFVLEKGMAPQKIILDPGIGFGKTVAHNLVLIKELHQVTALGYPVLIGPSRKSFIQKVLGKTTGKKVGSGDAGTEYGTLAACAASLMNGAHIIRVHDVETVCAFSHIIDAIRNA